MCDNQSTGDNNNGIQVTMTSWLALQCRSQRESVSGREKEEENENDNQKEKQEKEKARQQLLGSSVRAKCTLGGAGAHV
ncbi:hypothetical protein AWZ03_010729 [Drosophila navojoa]|uniref:Uncharacterized protein n=1 Tax=Drosophila navojoa TaxID=7232 RepID=A0A484B1V5_DRONA|nr:hypothetical protein AWZ03_010729 [Drosophila navojoa]